MSASKLRYAAYETPQAVPRLRGPSSLQRSSGRNSQSGTYSDNGEMANSRLSIASEGSSLDELSKTITAGDLALAAGGIKLEMMANVSFRIMCTNAIG